MAAHCLPAGASLLWYNTCAMVILSSPIGFANMTITFKEVEFPTDLTGCTHYVGHPSTKQILEALGAQPAPSGAKWGGPQVGEQYLAVPLASAQSREGGYTKDTAIESVKDLRAILCVRVA